MEAIASIIAVVPPVAIPLVVTILGIAYLYFKFRKVEDDRKVTKAARDEDSMKIHDTLLKHSFEITNLKGTSIHHDELLEDLAKQLAILNTNVVKLQVTIDSKFK